RLPDRFRHRGRELEPRDEIVDIDRMMLVRAAADDRHDAGVHKPEELHETAVARAVRLGDPDDGPLQPVASLGDRALGLELREPIDVLGPRDRRLVEPPVPSGTVNADRAAVDEALDAGLLADVEQIPSAAHVHRAEIVDADVGLVLRRREMKDRIGGFGEPAQQPQIVELSGLDPNTARLEALAASRFERRVLGPERDDVVALADETLGKPRSDEARGPGDQCVHPPTSLRTMRCGPTVPTGPPLRSLSILPPPPADVPLSPLSARTRERLILAGRHALRRREAGVMSYNEPSLDERNFL